MRKMSRLQQDGWGSLEDLSKRCVSCPCLTQEIQMIHAQAIFALLPASFGWAVVTFAAKGSNGCSGHAGVHACIEYQDALKI